jgi:glutaredoxin-related protein
MITNLPNHLQGDRALAEYFENMGLTVESVSVCRDVTTLKTFLDKRTKALLLLEKEWVKYVGNPSTVESYDPSDIIPDGDLSTLEGQPGRLVVPHRKRPTLRPRWFKSKVDALEYLEARYREADENVKKWRRSGKFRSTHAAFVTFEKMSSAVSLILGIMFVILLIYIRLFSTANRNSNGLCLPSK